MLGLTAEQRMEDYKYLWSVLADSYPCWGILDREGVDVEGIYTSYRDMEKMQGRRIGHRCRHG